MIGPSAGVYDPVPAIFVVPSYTSPSGEPVLAWDNENPLCTRHIRFRSRDSRELQKQHQTVSQTVCYINCRRDTVTEVVKPNTRIVHRGRTYEIVGFNPINYDNDEMEFICNTVSV